MNIADFWKWVKKTETCWEWQGGRHEDGYGQLTLDRRTARAHRIAWFLTHGEIPSGLCVLHRCDNPPCVRPDHLFLGSHRDNQHDCASKGRAAYFFKTPFNPAIKLTQAQIEEIGRLWLRGSNGRELARKFGVTPISITRALRRVSLTEIVA